MGAGRMNRLAVIERRMDSDDDAGGQCSEWVPITNGECWVEATPTRGGEGLSAGAVRGSESWRLETWWRDDVLLTDRIVPATGADWLPQGWAIRIDRLFDPDGRRRKLVMFGTAAEDFAQSDPPGV